MKTAAWFSFLLLCGCAGTPEGQTGTCRQSGEHAARPSEDDAECAITTFLTTMSTWTMEDLKAAVPNETEPGKYEVMLATLQAPGYRATPQRNSEDGTVIVVHRAQAWPLLNASGRAAAAARLGPGATPEAITLEKNRYAKAQIETGQVESLSFILDHIPFSWEGQQWAVKSGPTLIGSLTQP
ncbi:hypothetical protein K7W42_15155 [Deinococcus sp. HMF7604]|uniref:hypothetical protein n=1 Tax=Deinococcus TaxID=1298 RepID=UPI0018DC65FD|nr:MULTISPECIES: hypothetical protein [Deinococcus]MBZ9752192.1 hypothetical protein [Deinococcus betulae]